MATGSLQPNWFDREFEGPMEEANAKLALADIAKNPRIIKAVQDAINENETDIKKARAQGHVFAGPSRTQVVRRALTDVLGAAY